MTLDIILSTPDAELEIIPNKDHKAIPFKTKMDKPKLNLWDLYKIKMMLEEGYKLLEKEEVCD